jgi:hypothetical protein
MRRNTVRIVIGVLLAIGVVLVVGGNATPTHANASVSGRFASMYGGWFDEAGDFQEFRGWSVMANGAPFEVWSTDTAATPLLAGTTVPLYPMGSTLRVCRSGLAEATIAADVDNLIGFERPQCIVTVVRDTCPGCVEIGSLVDLSTGTFWQLAPLRQGLVGVSVEVLNRG